MKMAISLVDLSLRFSWLKWGLNFTEKGTEFVRSDGQYIFNSGKAQRRPFPGEFSSNYGNYMLHNNGKVNRFEPEFNKLNY